nr:hypothetical protein [Tanacetum cinerariifolium]
MYYPRFTKPKTSARRKRSGSDTSITSPTAITTPTTTVAVTPRLTTAAKGKQPADELYIDVGINQGRGIQATLEVKDSHVTLTPVNPDGQQESSSVSSQFMTSMLNPTSDAGVESIFATASTSMAHLPATAPTMTPSIIATITTTSQAPIPPTTVPSDMNEAVRVAVQLQTDRLRDASQKENDEFLRTSVNAQLEAEVLTRSSHSSRTSYVVAADLSEMELKKILIEKMEGNKSIQCSDEQRNLYMALVEAYEADKIILDTYRETVTLKRRRDDDDDKDEGPFAGPDRGSKRRIEGKEPESASAPSKTATRSANRSTTGSRSRQASASESAFAEEPYPEWFSQPQKPPTPDRDWNKTLPAVHGNTQPWISELAKQADTRSFFNELMDTPLDFSNFIMNRLRVDTLTPELFVGPTYELMKGSCKSLIELEYHLEEVYKATMDQLDWINPEDYDKHALWGVSHWGRKRQQFYGFTVNRESARDVYSKRRIIAVTKLKIVEWHSYKHLDWSTVRRDDDKLYKFKEGDFKRLRIQDIEDMPLLLVQGKLSNLTVEERFAFNVSLRMFTRSIVIQRHVEDLQVGVESYQKRLNLTKLDTYRSDLKRKEAYTAYSNPRGFIYRTRTRKTASDTLIDFQIKLSKSIGETVTHWFTLIVLSALRRSDNENRLSLIILILRSILTDLQVTPTKPR